MNFQALLPNLLAFALPATTIATLIVFYLNYYLRPRVACTVTNFDENAGDLKETRVFIQNNEDAYIEGKLEIKIKCELGNLDIKEKDENQPSVEFIHDPEPKEKNNRFIDFEQNKIIISKNSMRPLSTWLLILKFNNKFKNEDVELYFNDDKLRPDSSKSNHSFWIRLLRYITATLLYYIILPLLIFIIALIGELFMNKSLNLFMFVLSELLSNLDILLVSIFFSIVVGVPFMYFIHPKSPSIMMGYLNNNPGVTSTKKFYHNKTNPEEQTLMTENKVKNMINEELDKRKL